MLGQWFGRKKSRGIAAPPSSVDPKREEVRREVLRVAVRDTLAKHGIPAQWIAPETQSALTPQRLRGLHLRLVLREWQPQLLEYCVDLQRTIRARIHRLDPLAPNWLTGISWDFDLADASACPPLPRSPVWTQQKEKDGSRARSETGKLDTLARAFKSGDQRFGSRGGNEHPDFSPTQPMLHRT